MTIKSSGITGGMAFLVKITGYRSRPNEFIKPGTVGLLEPIELAMDGQILNARFYPEGLAGGFGLVMWPMFESGPFADEVPMTKQKMIDDPRR